MGVPRLLNKMKKKTLKLLLFVIIAISIWIYYYLIFFYLLLSLYLYFAYKKLAQLRSNYPSWEMFNQNLKRNYEFAIIGGSSAYKTVKKYALKEDFMNWTLPEQHFLMCFQCIKHYFGILKEHGEIYMLIDDKDLLLQDKRDCLPFHRTIFHPWLFERIALWRICIFSPLWILKCYGVRIYSLYTKCKCDTSSNIKIVEDMALFLRERDLNLILVPLKTTENLMNFAEECKNVQVKCIDDFLKQCECRFNMRLA